VSLDASRFTNRRVLATGGMATVYRADDTELGIPVAIKEILLAPTLSARAHQQMGARLKREARTLQKLDHPNIVRCLGVIESGEHPYIVTELLEGVTLEQEILSSRIVGVRLRILDVFSQVCDGLEYARRKGIVHRDIKPGNIFLCTSGVVKIIDFGIARAEDSVGITVDGQILGTPHFMSPEQAAGTGKVDYRSDIFSLGTCIFHTITGHVPFDGTGHFDVENSVRFNPMPRGCVWPDIEPVIAKALEKDPGDRYQSFTELRQALQVVMKADMVAAEMPCSDQVIPPPVPAASGDGPCIAPIGADRPWPTALPQPRGSASGTSATTSVVAPAILAALGFTLLVVGIATDSPSLVIAGALVIAGGALVLATTHAASDSTSHIHTNPVIGSPGAALQTPVPGPPLIRRPPETAPPHSHLQRVLRFTINGVPGASAPSTNDTFEIGREQACHVCLQADPRVSGRHATLSVSSGGSTIYVRDHSSNGTFVHGRRIVSVEILFGTPMKLGTTDLVIDGAYDHSS